MDTIRSNISNVSTDESIKPETEERISSTDETHRIEFEEEESKRSKNRKEKQKCSQFKYRKEDLISFVFFLLSFYSFLLSLSSDDETVCRIQHLLGVNTP